MKKRTFSQILSAVLTFVVIFTLLPAAFAEGDSAPRVSLTSPTAERIFFVVNDLVGDEYGFINTEPYLEYLPMDDGTNIKLDDLVNEDGIFTERTIEAIKYALEQGIASGDLPPAQFEGMEIPGDIYSVLELLADALHEIIVATLTDMELTDEAAAFAEDFPDGAALYQDMMESAFGEGVRPSVTEVLHFIIGDYIVVNDEGYLCMQVSDPFTTEDERLYFLEESIAPSGAYVQPREVFGNNRNVYVHLKSAWEVGEIDSAEAFTILTGYTTDINGNLYTIYPEYDYVLDGEGKRTYDILDLVNEDGTVLDTGLSVRDLAIKTLAEQYADPEGVINELFEAIGSEFIIYYTSVIMEYVPMDQLVEDGGDHAAQVDSYIEMMEGFTEDEINEMLLTLFCGFETDPFGYVVAGMKDGYIYDESGKKLNIADIMDDEGNFVTDEYGCENVSTLMEAYLAEMSLEAVLKGDATDDGKVNVSDAAAVLKQIAKWDIDIDTDAADANADGKVNLGDVTLVLQYIAGWDVQFVY